MKGIREFGWLLRKELFVFRTRWFWFLVMITLSPVVTAFFLRFVMGADVERLRYIVTGSMSMALTTSAMLTLGQDLGTMKDFGAFEYYASLPISKARFILAMATKATMLALPPSMITLLMGITLFRLPVHLSVATIPGLLVAGYSLAGLGAFIGFYCPDGRVTGWVTQIVNPLLVFMAPVYVPAESLPRFLRLISRFFPTTYVADILRASLGGGVSARTWWEVFGLFVWTVLSLWLASSRLSWRAKE